MSSEPPGGCPSSEGGVEKRTPDFFVYRYFRISMHHFFKKNSSDRNPCPSTAHVHQLRRERDQRQIVMITQKLHRRIRIFHSDKQKKQSQKLTFVVHLTGIPIYLYLDSTHQPVHRDLNAIDHRYPADDYTRRDDWFCLSINNRCRCMPVPA